MDTKASPSRTRGPLGNIEGISILNYDHDIDYEFHPVLDEVFSVWLSIKIKKTLK